MKNFFQSLLNNAIILAAIIFSILSILFWILYFVYLNEVFIAIASGMTTSFSITVFFEIAKLIDLKKKRELLYVYLFYALMNFEKKLESKLHELNNGVEYDIYSDSEKTKNLINESDICETQKILFLISCSIYDYFSDFQNNKLYLLISNLIGSNEYIIFANFSNYISEYNKITKKGELRNYSNVKIIKRLIIGAYEILSDIRFYLKAFSKYKNKWNRVYKEYVEINEDKLQATTISEIEIE